jgi:hypothetical protein
MATFGRPFKPVEQKFRKGKLFTGGTSYFNQRPQQPTGSALTQVFTKPQPPREPQPPTTVTPPAPPVTLGRNVRYFKEDRAVTIDPGAAGRVNPPAPPPVASTNPWATWGAQFDPNVNPATWYGPTEGLRTSLQQSRHGYTNADRQLWQDFLNTVTTGYRGDMHERKVQQMMQTPDGWLKLSQEYMQTKGFYTPPTDTGTTDTGATTTDYSQYMIPTVDVRKQLLTNDGYRTRYLELVNKTLGMHLGTAQFMAMLNSTNEVVIKMFEQMHERLRSSLGTGGTRPPTGGVGA